MRTALAVCLLAVSFGWLAAAQEAAAPAASSENGIRSEANTTLAKALPASPGLGSPQPLLSPGPMMPIAPGPAIAPQPAPLQFPGGKVTHHFLDKENMAIFAALAAARTMDPISTWQFRRHGLHEGELSDGFVDNKPLFAAYSASLLAGQVAASYFFHRMGWHKLERISAMVHTSAVTEAVIHNYHIGNSH